MANADTRHAKRDDEAQARVYRLIQLVTVFAWFAISAVVGVWQLAWNVMR